MVMETDFLHGFLFKVVFSVFLFFPDSNNSGPGKCTVLAREEGNDEYLFPLLLGAEEKSVFFEVFRLRKKEIGRGKSFMVLSTGN